MAIRDDVREFLMSRRARVTPEAVGLPGGGNRRVTGLRRSEVAAVAGMSVEYYSRIERGAIGGASAAVLDAIARALMLTEPERDHLFDLARASDGSPVTGPGRARRASRPVEQRPALRWAIEAITEGVAVVRNARQEILAANALGRAFYAPVFEGAERAGTSPNFARFQFLDPASHDFYPDWQRFAEMCVANMRAEAGRDPFDRGMHDLIGELSTRSDTFRSLWGAHDVRRHGAGTKRFCHPLVGELTLAYEDLGVTAEPGITVLVYTAEPGSPSADRLRLLASWAATTEAEAPATAGSATTPGPASAPGSTTAAGSTTTPGTARTPVLRDRTEYHHEPDREHERDHGQEQS